MGVAGKGLGVAGLLAMLSLAGTSAVCAHDPFTSLKMSRTQAGVQAVPFELTSLDGTRIKLSDLAGKVVLVNFWATWCGPCKEEMPSLARLQQQLDP
ncbi:MAG TPA: TlpA disulfide reductase family protein, partial [Nitrospira sp.]